MWRQLPTGLGGDGHGFCCFFCQAEDGIRDLTVTGVQTCALPISAQARRQYPRPGAGDARLRLYHRRPVPGPLGRRSDPDPDAAVPAAAAARGGIRLSRLPRCRRGVVGFGGNSASFADGAHAAGGHDPRRSRRHADGGRGRHPDVEAVHAGVLPRRGPGRAGRVHRRPDHVGLPGPRRGHAAARADRGDPRRRRQPRRRFRRQLRHRLRLYLRRGALPAARLRDPVPADDFRHRFPAARAVREVRGVKLAALALMLVAFPFVAGEFYVNLASQIFIFAIFAASINLLLGYGGSPFGAALRGTRDQPRRMSALGHNVWLIRWITFVYAGFWGAVSGLLFVYYHKYIHPISLSLTNSAEGLLAVIAGGSGTLGGPLAGAAIVMLLKNYVSAYIERWNMLLGFVFVIIVVFMPEGVVPGTRRIYLKCRRLFASRT